MNTIWNLNISRNIMAMKGILPKAIKDISFCGSWGYRSTGCVRFWKDNAAQLYF